MIMAGAKNSVGVALLSVVIGLGAGVALGLLAAARGGAIDEIVMRGNDLIFAFPSLFAGDPDHRGVRPGAVNAIAAIGIFNIPVFRRVTRGAGLALWTRDYTAAARVRQGAVPHLLRTHFAKPLGTAGRAGHHPVLVGGDRRSGPSPMWVLVRSRRHPVGDGC